MMDDNSDPFPELGSVYKKATGFKVNQLSQNVANIMLNASAEDGITTAGKACSSSRTTTSAWESPNLILKLGLQNKKEGNFCVTQNVDFKNFQGSGNALSFQQSDDMEHSWNSIAASQVKDECISNPPVGSVVDDKKRDIVDEDYDDEIVFDSDGDYDDDEDISDDGSDSDTSEKSHETRKKSKWFKDFFDIMDTLTSEELVSRTRRWHCTACQGGPGAIDWYRGLEPLMHHAKTKQTRRAKLHRIFAELLDDELCRKKISVTPVGNVFGSWEGLNEKVDYDIVWPPMVIIMNTIHGQDENGKRVGMGNQELRDYFNSYAVLKAHSSYGPQGHRGMSALIFESSVAGYLEAARLHKHFKEEGRDRDAWVHNRVPFCSGGKRQLYGYMALKEDLDIFNRHSQGRSKLKFEMKSYREMVDSKIKQINDDSQQLVEYKTRFAKEQKHSQALAESLHRLGDKLRETTEENGIVQQPTKLLLKQNDEKMDSQEQLVKYQIKLIHQAVAVKEDNFEKLLQAIQEKVKQSNANPSAIGYMHSETKITGVPKLQDKEMVEFKAERKKLIKRYEDKKVASMNRYREEQLQLDEEYENELTQLMERYILQSP